VASIPMLKGILLGHQVAVHMQKDIALYQVAIIAHHLDILQ